MTRSTTSRLLLATTVMLVASSLHAATEVVRNYRFSTEGITELQFRGGVGEMVFEPGAAGEVRLVLEIEGDDGGWLRPAKDVDDVELVSEVRGNQLILSQDDKETKTTWRVLLPEVARTRIKFGVGEIDGEFGATALDVDLGVGDIDLELPFATTGRVDLSAGVGDAGLHGAREVHAERAFVAQDVQGEGDGTFDLRVQVGVGDIDVNLRR